VRGSCQAFDEDGELTLESGKCSIDEFTARDDDEIAAGLGFVMSEQFARAALRAIPDDRSAHFPGCGDAQSRMADVIRDSKQRHEPAADFGACLVGALEVPSLPHVLRWSKRRHHRGLARKRV
jgi:hypothetical protein